MDTVKVIKSILEKKQLLESNIRSANQVVGHVNMLDLSRHFAQNGHTIDVRVSRELMNGALNAQIAADQKELDGIDKQLDAIGALMGAGNV